MSFDRVVLGTANLGADGRDAAFELLDAYVELGGRVIDTASVYSDWLPGGHGRSETTIGDWLKSRGGRDRLSIVTKGAHPKGQRPRCDAASIRSDVELSLKRLGIEQIDLWYLHRDDPSRPVAEMVGVLRDLVREGKIARFGGSNWTRPRLEQALGLGGTTLSAVQNLGNAFCRIMNPMADKTCVVIDAPTLLFAAERGLTIDLYTSSAHGYFERRAKGVRPTRDYDNAACDAAATSLERIAAKVGVAPANMIVAFLLWLAAPVRVLVGPRDAGQLRQMGQGGAIRLDRSTVEEIAAAVGMSDFLR